MRKGKRYLVAYVTQDRTVEVMGNDKDWKYAKEICDLHNKYVIYPSSRWEIFPLTKSIYPRGK